MKVTVYVDGGVATNPGPGAIAAVVGDEKGELVVESSRKLEHATNNEAEYLALSLGISLAHLVGATHVNFCSDSQLVVSQVGGWWAINGSRLSVLHGSITGRLMSFEEWSIQHVQRSENRRADWLCNELLDLKSKHQLKEKPTSIEFRTGRARPGWANFHRRAEYA